MLDLMVGLMQKLMVLEICIILCNVCRSTNAEFNAQTSASRQN